MTKENVLVGAFEAPTVSLIKNAGYPSGRLAPDPGLKFLVVVVRLADEQKQMLLDDSEDRLFADGRTYPALGISSGMMMCGALDTFVGVPKAGMEILGESRGYLYSVLFAVLKDVNDAEVQLSGMSRRRLPLIDHLPNDLGTLGDGAQMRFLKSMGLPHALPFGHQADELGRLARHELPPDRCGILAQGAVDGVGVVFARAALGADVQQRIEIDSIVGQLDDGTSIACLGSIVWATFLKEVPNGPCSMSGIAHRFEDLEIVGGPTDVKLDVLKSYRGPTTQIREREVKLALRFQTEVVDRIRELWVNGRRLG